MRDPMAGSGSGEKVGRQEQHLSGGSSTIPTIKTYDYYLVPTTAPSLSVLQS